MAASWKQLQTGITSLNLGQSANKFARGFSSSVQATKERLGQIAPEEITELPQGMSLSSWSACMAKLNLGLQSTRTWKPASMHCGRRTLVYSSELLSSRVRKGVVGQTVHARAACFCGGLACETRAVQEQCSLLVRCSSALTNMLHTTLSGPWTCHGMYQWLSDTLHRLSFQPLTRPILTNPS